MSLPGPDAGATFVRALGLAAALRPIPAYLQPDEERLVEERRHPMSLVDAAIGVTVLLLLVGVGAWYFFNHVVDRTGFVAPILVLLGVVWVSVLFGIWIRVRTSRYVVTDARVYRSFGRFRFDLLQTTYDKVTDLHVRQSFFGRLFGFGDVTLQTAGVGLTLAGVADPFGMKRQVEAARTRFLETLMREYGAERAAERAEETDQEKEVEDEARPAPAWVPVVDSDTVLWRGRPVGWSLVGPFANLVIMGFIGVALLGAGALGGVGPFSLFGPLLVLIAVFSFVASYIQYRHTRYEVSPVGVVVTSGWLSRRRVETTYDKVTDVATYQGFVGRIFDFGNITVNTAGSERAPVVFKSLAQPEQVKRLIDEARRKRETGRRGSL